MVPPWAPQLTEVHTKHHHKANWCTATRRHVHTAIGFRCQKYLNMIAGGGLSKAVCSPVTTEAAAECGGWERATWTCRLATRSGVKVGLSCLGVRVTEARFSLTWVSCDFTEVDWVNRFVTGCPCMGRPGLSLHTDAAAWVLPFFTHILASICTNKGCMARSYLAYPQLAGDKVPCPPCRCLSQWLR